MVSSLTEKPAILFIVEGASAEPKLVKKISSVVGEHQYFIYPYHTAIYELYEQLFADSDLDLLLVLKERENDSSKRMMLSKKYMRTYLVFDFDPQHQKYSHDKLIRLISYFNDSTDKGKLYINYPMMESHRHLSLMPDVDFIDRKINIDQISRYKKIVGDFTYYSDLNNYTYEIVTNMIAHHMIKYNKLVFDSVNMPSYEDYKNWSFETDLSLLSKQIESIENGFIYVINSSIFYVVDIKPKTFFYTRLSHFSLG